MRTTDFTIGYLRECFDADLVAGTLRWKVRPLAHFPDAKTAAMVNARHAGQLVTTVRGGYSYVRVKRHLLVHRVLYAFAKNIDLAAVPAIIDHADGNPLNNSIQNLRPASPRQSTRNRGFMSTNTSGLIGVSYCNRHEKWRAKINNGSVEVHLGYFDTKEEAGAAYRGAAIILHDEFFRETKSKIQAAA